MLVGASANAQGPRAKGWVREPGHVVAATPLLLPFQAYLPEEADLSAKFPVPGNQGHQSSCTAWATGYAVRSYHEGKRRNWGFSSPSQIISPAYIYNRLVGFRGACDAGTSISDALKLLKTDGAPTLSTYPYQENDCSRPANPEQVQSGSEFRISGWSAVDSRRLDDVKGQIAGGQPVMFGMEVSERFENLTGGEIYDDTSSPRTGGHAMVLVGYSERRQAFKIMNSWGTQWGDGGFGWISYRALKQLSDVMFVMEVPDSLPPSPPTPEPRPAPRPAPPPVVTPPAPPPGPVVVTPPAPAPQPAPEPPRPVAPPPVATVQARIQSRLRAMACARVEGKLASDGVVRLRGFAGSADDLARLRADLLALPRVRAVKADVTLYPWPQCEVFLNFAEALKTPRGLAARLRGASPRGFLGGDSLSIEVVTPAYPSYLYVTYLQAGGDAANLYWPEGRTPKALTPGRKITVGGGAGGEPVYRITAPFGDEIVVVVASASPLFREEPPETATGRDYLTTFRKSMLAGPDGAPRVVSAVAVPLTTRPRP